MARPRPHRVRDRRQLEALVSPVRQQLVQALAVCQPCTVKELAAHVGRLPESLYYHVRKLVEAGLVVERERRPTSRRAEAVYELVGSPLRIDPDPRSPAALEAVRKLGAGLLRLAERLHAAAVTDPDAVREGPRREVALGQRTVRLTPRGLGRVNAKVTELLDVVGEEHAGAAADARTFTVTVQLAPNELHETSAE